MSRSQFTDRPASIKHNTTIFVKVEIPMNHKTDILNPLAMYQTTRYRDQGLSSLVIDYSVEGYFFPKRFNCAFFIFTFEVQSGFAF